MKRFHETKVFPSHVSNYDLIKILDKPIKIKEHASYLVAKYKNKADIIIEVTSHPIIPESFGGCVRYKRSHLADTTDIHYTIRALDLRPTMPPRRVFRDSLRSENSVRKLIKAAIKQMATGEQESDEWDSR